MKNIHSKTIIYTLSDPRDMSIAYVGKTTQKLNYRLVQHLTEPSNNKRKTWIKSLKRKGLIPIIEEIDNCEWKDSDDLEKYWISQLKVWGFILKNMTDGGGGSLGLPINEGQKAKMSLIMKNKYKNGFIHPMLGRTHTKEAREAISKAHLGKKLSESHVEILRNKVMGKKLPEKAIKNMIETHGKRVIMLDLGGNYIREFYTLIEAARFLNKKCSAKIVECCKNKREKVYGYKWIYKTDYFKELPKADQMTEEIYSNIHEIMKP